MQRVHPAKRFPIQAVGPVQDDFRELRVALQWTAERAAQEHIHAVKRGMGPRASSERASCAV